jgi:DtxR family Mn-dependent transcriptional regulator
VVRVSDDDAAMLRYLGELGLTIGAEVTVQSREPYGGPIALRVGHVQRQIGPALAAAVLVETG